MSHLIFRHETINSKGAASLVDVKIQNQTQHQSPAMQKTKQGFEKCYALQNAIETSGRNQALMKDKKLKQKQNNSF